jgi:phosphonate metabolism-associated iron-containing alcohol dehydrogenase
MNNWQQIKQQHKLIETEDFVSLLPDLIPPGNTLLLTSAGFTRRGVSQKILTQIDTTNALLCDQITANPEIHDLQNWFATYQHSEINTIVALGGGSVIDSAKVLCAMFSQPKLSLPDLLNISKPTKNIHLIAIPTTSGTGAEVTPFATVWDSKAVKKHSLNGITADKVILDASLTLSLPWQQTLYPALDALSHALESLWNKNRTDSSTAYANQAIEAICQALPLVLDQTDNLPARQTLQRAATLAGLAICQTRTAIAHAISYPLTAAYGIPHGLACSFTLSGIIREFGSVTLNVSSELTDKVLKLLQPLDLAREMAKYVDCKTLLQNFDPQLDQARAENFIIQVEASRVTKLISDGHTIAKSE